MKINPLQFSWGFLLLTLFVPFMDIAAEKQVTTTDIGTYDVSLETKPATPQLNQNMQLSFEVISKNIQQAQVHVDYKISILKDNIEVFSSGAGHTHTGLASVSHTFDSPGEYVVEVLINGIVFKPIPAETASYSLQVGQAVEELPESEIKEKPKEPIGTSTKTFIPDWIKQVAEFWVADQIDDSGFVQVIEYLVQQDIITIPYAEAPEGEAAIGIPVWIKTTAEFWVNGDVSDDEFATALEWLINNGIIQV